MPISNSPNLAALQSSIIAAVTAARDNVKAEVVAKATETQNAVSAEVAAKATATQTAINAEVAAKATATQTAVNAEVAAKATATQAAIAAKSAIKSINRGTTTLSGGSGSATIPAINMSKAWLKLSQRSNTATEYRVNSQNSNTIDAASATNYDIAGRIASSTSLSFSNQSIQLMNGSSTYGSPVVEWEVIEYV
jgi:hypothetical protein